MTSVVDGVNLVQATIDSINLLASGLQFLKSIEPAPFRYRDLTSSDSTCMTEISGKDCEFSSNWDEIRRNLVWNFDVLYNCSQYISLDNASDYAAILVEHPKRWGIATLQCKYFTEGRIAVGSKVSLNYGSPNVSNPTKPRDFICAQDLQRVTSFEIEHTRREFIKNQIQYVN